MTHALANRQSLSIDEIHVWTAHLVDGHDATTDLLPLLGEEERTRAARFAFECDRIRFIQAHGIVRQILANYSDTDAATLKFAYNHHGKPYLVTEANGPNIQFSVSHSGNCCVLALRLDRSIGVDVEQVRDLPQAERIAHCYFTPAETKLLDTLQGTSQHDAFFVLWTHKEAIVKGLGISLAANLGRIEFDLDPVQGLQLAAWDGDPTIARTWSILRFDPAPGYVAAVASVHPIRTLALKNWLHNAAD
jgi:4'-phosphopantetheinyl transferase